ncbi:DUF6308 family protein [Modestobacter marinus]|uniref:DUF6308 family protein n=1 Tax=Modestobacter marinus TaxID=477641 RepID=UPI001C975836|nr:DUF6308 family protein [Modestobacter marinus]
MTDWVIPHNLNRTISSRRHWLDAPLRGRDVIKMHRPDGPYRVLRDAMAKVVSDEEAATALFQDQDLTADVGPWSLVRAALHASDSTPHIKASKVTKVLHRKRPALVPIFDSKVASYYGVSAGKPWLFWPLIQADLRAHGDRLQRLARDYETSDGRRMTALRALDIIVWEHCRGCEPTRGAGS